MSAAFQTLQVVRINAIMQALQDVREIPADLKFLQRTPVVPATDNEIIGRFNGRIQIADIVADDQAAVVYSTGKLTFETTTIPNLKHGVNLTQEMLNQLLAINANGGIGDDQGIFSNYENRVIDGLLLGIRQRMEALIIAMKLDSFNYDRLGIKITGSWGMPSDLKVTPATPWTDAANAEPVNDILTLKLTGSVRYGINYNRITMTTQAFRVMIATAEFQAKARMFLAPNVSYVNLSMANLQQQQQIAESVLGMTIELYDSRYWSQGENGVATSAPYLPINKVILSDSNNDNSPAVTDFANSIVTESIVSALAPTNMIGRFAGPVRGPIAYATAPPDLNPPQITYWGVARGFPRKYILQETAVLTVGTLVDAIPVGEPF